MNPLFVFLSFPIRFYAFILFLLSFSALFNIIHQYPFLSGIVTFWHLILSKNWILLYPVNQFIRFSLPTIIFFSILFITKTYSFFEQLFSFIFYPFPFRINLLKSVAFNRITCILYLSPTILLVSIPFCDFLSFTSRWGNLSLFILFLFYIKKSCILFYPGLLLSIIFEHKQKMISFSIPISKNSIKFYQFLFNLTT